ncbi:MAG: hypothetical protein LBV23_10145 [Deltaproteobacteria bacterium]|jgi:hypothetical protein|nr:hypothetical protein [Deltaproteobacteria bacterium]
MRKKDIRYPPFIFVGSLLVLMGLVVAGDCSIEAQTDRSLLLAARPNPYNRGNCYQWKNCLGESLGNMLVETPEFCGPLGGKSWKSEEGECVNLLETPWGIAPEPAG